MPPSADLIKRWSKFSPFLRNSKNVWNAEQIKARLRWHFVYITWSQLPPPPPFLLSSNPDIVVHLFLGAFLLRANPRVNIRAWLGFLSHWRNKSFVRISRQFKLLSRYLNKSSQFSLNGVRGKYCLILIIFRKWHLLSPTLVILTFFSGIRTHSQWLLTRWKAVS